MIASRHAGSALVAAAALSWLAVTVAPTRADEPEAGRLVTLRSGPTSSIDVDLGGPSREGRLARSLAGERHAVVDRIALPGRRSTAPLEWDDRLALGTSEGLFVREADGRTQSLALGPIDVRPVVLPTGELVVITREGRALALRRDLAIVREARLGAQPRGVLVLADGSLVITTQDRRLTRLDAGLAPRFTVPIAVGQAGIAHSPTFVAPDRLALAIADRVLLLDLSGQLVASVGLGDRAASAVVAAPDGSLHVLLVSGHIAVLEHGRLARRLPLGGRVLDDGAVLARDGDGSYRVAIATLGVLAVEPDGTVRWTYATDAPFHGPLAIDASQRTLAFDRRGRLAVIDTNGERLEQVELGGITHGFPMIARDGTLWASTDAAELVHLGPSVRPTP